ncbi:MAG TPA: RICIN domain-containing protein [Ktedonosporobacter sp.]|nr:RICIN domain-containing protein [Ktedonosporobacter sp.]
MAFNGPGTYTIVSDGSGKAVDVTEASQEPGAPIIQFDLSGAPNQQWRIQDEGDGTFTLISVNSDLLLDATRALAMGMPAVQAPPNGRPNQLWQIRPIPPDGQKYMITSAGSGMTLTVGGDGGNNDDPIITLPYNGTPNQRWIINQV